MQPVHIAVSPEKGRDQQNCEQVGDVEEKISPGGQACQE
jgi:hypothetical protein